MDPKVAHKLNSFFSKFNRHNFKKGEILMDSQTKPKGVMLLEKGLVKVYAITASGEEQVINLFKPLSFFPTAWAINNSKVSYLHEAVLDSEVLIAPKDEFVKFLKSNPDVSFDLLKRLYNGLDGYMLRMQHLMSPKAENKIISQIVILSKRFGNQRGNKSEVGLKLTHSQLATFVGLSRETVTREINKLEEKGLIKYNHNNLKILKSKELEDLLFIA